MMHMKNHFTVVFSIILCLVVVCSCSPTGNELPSGSINMPKEKEPGSKTVLEMAEKFEDYIRSNTNSVLTVQQFLPSSEWKDYNYQPIIENTVIKNQKLVSALEYATGDVVLFFEPLAESSIIGSADVSEQLKNTNGSDYAYIGCIVEGAEYCIVILSNDTDRGKEIERIYYNIMIGRY